VPGVPLAGGAAGALPGATLPGAVPCGRRVSVNRVPSAVFSSVTGVFTFSVSVDAPFAYDPPATETFAVDVVSEMSWNIGFADGKFDPVVTDSLVPFTEMTAAVGGAVGGAGGVFGGLLVLEPPPWDDEELLDDDVVAVDPAPGPPALNGSLLSKSENDSSWPVPAGACTASMSWDEPFGGAAAALGSGALSVGAAGSAALGVGAGVADPVVLTAAGSGFDDPPLELSDVIVCTAYAIAAASTTTRPIAIFFCFCAFALAASATFFLRATSSPLLPTSARWRCQPTHSTSFPQLWSSRPPTYRLCLLARGPLQHSPRLRERRR
jgi:hypothetical protein